MTTLIQSKYDYKPIDRKQIDGKRKYMTPDGGAVASVTTILDATSDKSGLMAWRKRVGEKKAQEIVTEAAGVGTRMHSILKTMLNLVSYLHQVAIRLLRKHTRWHRK
jgi:hypothetical protein